MKGHSSQTSMPLSTAVLFLAFNRPDTTKKVFSEIRKARPPRLYLAVDGPRNGRDGEADRVDHVKRIVTDVDWPCEVKTLFREANLGCKDAIIEAINWFFEHEKQGIILEDDCFPHQSFFKYCEWALREFGEDKRIWHVGGNNFDAPIDLYNSKPYGFTSFAQVWGWATWADRWNLYEGNPFYLYEETKKNRSQWSVSWRARIANTMHLEQLKSGLDTWDYQWQITMLNHGGLALSASNNMISNLGDGPDATHTFGDSRARLPTSNFVGFQSGVSIERRANRKIDKWYEEKMNLRSILPLAKFIKVSCARSFGKYLGDKVSKVIFSEKKPIIIASTGRSGSSLLFRSVVEGYIKRRRPTLARLFPKTMRKLAGAFIARLDDIESMARPVGKTHDLFTDACASNATVIFIYGDPLESALSVENQVKKNGASWFDHHVFHLRSRGRSSDLYQADVLNYRNQMDSWVTTKRENVLVLHYDQLWEMKNEISHFLGFEVSIPLRRQRSAKSLPNEYSLAMFDSLRKLERAARDQ